MASRSMNGGDGGRGSRASRRSNSSLSNRRPQSLEEVIMTGAPPPPLSFGDRIVWLSDSGPEYGYVKWLGKLPDVGSDWMAGVDFDHPVGSGTGLYNDHQLFEAPMNHASLVPVIGLIRAEDFDHSSSEAESPDGPPKNRVIQMQRVQRNILPPLSSPASSSSTTGSSAVYHLQQHMSDLILPDPKITNEIHSSSSSGILNSIPAGPRVTFAREDRISPPALVSSSTLRLESNRMAENNRGENRLIDSLSEKQQMRERDVIRNNQVLKPLPQINGKSSLHSESSSSVSSGSSEGLEVGSLVIVNMDGLPRFGVIRWIGFLDSNDDHPDSRGPESPNHLYHHHSSSVHQKLIDDENPHEILNNDHSPTGGKPSSVMMAGVELEEECSGCCDGTSGGKRYFSCSQRRGCFVPLSQCKKDTRFNLDRRRSALFGSIDCPTVSGDVPPLSTQEDLNALCGKNRGIQGHHNSCYLDATLFAMFSCTTIFESLLHRPPTPDDIPEYCEVQRVLKEEIVNPLRANLYVRADRVMHLRTLLEKLSSVRGLTSEEKDPEEFLNLVLNEILKAEPFLKLSSGLESFFYQLFVEKDEKLVLPTVQQLFEQSFLASDIKLRQVPPCLLIQMPRFGRQFKMYPRIIPSLYLDITDVLENSPRQCCICGSVAHYECKNCFGQFGEGLDSTAFCHKCVDRCHANKKRTKHQITKLSVPAEFRMQLRENSPQVPRVFMELFAVLCIETSHYVAFVKCGSGPDAPWCFFDSMADRKGEQNGYNIPEVVSFPDLRWWLSEEGTVFLLTTKDDKLLPEMARRLLCDAYMCFYQSTDQMTHDDMMVEI